MRSAATYALAILTAISGATAQAVKGTAYGFAAGVTGGGDIEAAAPSSADELAEWLADDTPRVILIDQEYDFTGTTAEDAGCYQESCPVSQGGQETLGADSCTGDGSVAIGSVTYDAAGPEALPVGSNKSIISSNGKGVLKGKGLSIAEGSSNVIIQGIEITDINPEFVWGGDALELRGKNDGVWVDHCKFSLTGRMFIVGHYYESRLTVSNTEFDGTTDWSSSCNGDHYWTMMFYGDGSQVTLDRNYVHDCSGRAPKLGEDGVSGTFHATNNYFANMGGHAFDAYDGASAIIEGNVFEAVDQPLTDQATTVSTLFNTPDGFEDTCSDYIGRACIANSVTDSGDFSSMDSTDAFSAFSDLSSDDYIITPMPASEVKDYVTSNAGPANLASYTGFDGSASASASNSTVAAKSTSSGESACGSIKKRRSLRRRG